MKLAIGSGLKIPTELDQVHLHMTRTVYTSENNEAENPAMPSSTSSILFVWLVEESGGALNLNRTGSVRTSERHGEEGSKHK